MRRRGIPGTPSPRRRVEIATGGDPVRALAAALSDLGALGICHVAHDLGCPCLAGRPLDRCTCEILALTAERRAA